MKESLPLKDFIYLLLAMSAKYDDRRYNMNSGKTKTAVLPLNYKEVIEDILCEPNGWKYRFSRLINIDEYFENHFRWERNFSRELKAVASELNKKITYDLEYDHLLIDFTDEEVEAIFAKYSDIDEETKHRIRHFAILLNDLIFRRQYKEESHPEINYVARNAEEIEKYNNKDKTTENEDITIETYKTKKKRKNFFDVFKI